MTAPALEIERLRFRYPAGDGWVVDIDALNLAEGEQVLLTGRSGRGKSTLLYLIAGLIDPTEGHVRIHGQDIHARGLDKDVAVVLWGEFGRAPKISRGDGRDHWPEAGAAVIAGGGFRMGQVIGETDSHGGQSKGVPYTPGNILSNMYHHLGIDPAKTLPDHLQRPVHILDEREPVRELAG